MKAQIEVLKRFYELSLIDPDRFYKASELDLKLPHRVLYRCVASLFSSDFLILDAPTCLKNLVKGGQVVRRYKLNPNIKQYVEELLYKNEPL